MTDLPNHAVWAETGAMQLDPRETWPDDEPKGSFDIMRCRVEGYPECTARILFVCPNGKRCGVLLGPSAVPRSEDGRLNVWGWDGNVDRPTITPSINCIAEKDGISTGGCGWHGFVTAGVMR